MVCNNFRVKFGFHYDTAVATFLTQMKKINKSKRDKDEYNIFFKSRRKERSSILKELTVGSLKLAYLRGSLHLVGRLRSEGNPTMSLVENERLTLGPSY